MSVEWSSQQASGFAATLAALRLRARLSQRKLAELSGLSHSTVARLETTQIREGQEPIRPTPATLRKIASGLASDPHHPQSVDGELAARHYQDLMNAARYTDTLVDPGAGQAPTPKAGPQLPKSDVPATAPQGRSDRRQSATPRSLPDELQRQLRRYGMEPGELERRAVLPEGTVRRIIANPSWQPEPSVLQALATGFVSDASVDNRVSLSSSFEIFFRLLKAAGHIRAEQPGLMTPIDAGIREAVDWHNMLVKVMDRQSKIEQAIDNIDNRIQELESKKEEFEDAMQQTQEIYDDLVELFDEYLDTQFGQLILGQLPFEFLGQIESVLPSQRYDIGEDPDDLDEFDE